MVGTSGYSYTDWVGPFYPKGTQSDKFLEHYGEHFSTVELNFSYYRMPEAEQLRKMSEVNSTLSFTLKAHQSLTHKVIPSAWRQEAKTFRQALEPLLEANALKAILLQFPYSFHYEVNQRRYLDALLRYLDGLPLAVEFRHIQWYNNRTIEALRERQVALVALDLPNLTNLPPHIDVVTAPFAYLRLHGRNRENWWGSDVANRYDYLYSPQELTAIVERAQTLSANTPLTLVYFNNHKGGQAVQNALALKGLLDG